MNYYTKYALRVLERNRYSLNTEKQLQSEIMTSFMQERMKVSREYRLDNNNIVDFYVNGTAIEVKIKGSARDIYKQLERYAEFESVTELILVTNKAMGLPPTIKGKPCYYVSLGKNWL